MHNKDRIFGSTPKVMIPLARFYELITHKANFLLDASYLATL
jgi:hypothetical protein